MRPRDRERVMSALHPELGPTLAAWWVAAQDQPYTTGWARRAFRAPTSPGITRLARATSLRATLDLVGPFRQEPVWVAGWAAHLGRAKSGRVVGGDYLLGPLLAAAIDAGGAEGDAVLSALRQIVLGEHPVGVMGRYAIVGLLRCSRQEGWELVERLLLAAQGQEGLRSGSRSSRRPTKRTRTNSTVSWP